MPRTTAFCVSAALLVLALIDPAIARSGGHGGMARMGTRASGSAFHNVTGHTGLPIAVKPSVSGVSQSIPPPSAAAKQSAAAPAPVRPTRDAAAGLATSTLPQPITLPPGPPLAPIDPLPQSQGVAPPAPTPPTTAATSGGTSGVLTVSVPGGGGETLADCMGFWDAATHMSKGEWRSTCMRAKAGYDDLTVHAAATGDRAVHKRVASRKTRVGHAAH